MIINITFRNLWTSLLLSACLFTAIDSQAQCPTMALASDGATSGNFRGLNPNFRKGITVFLITQAELAAAGITNGKVISGVSGGFTTAPSAATAGNLQVYMENTADASNLKSTTWATAVSTMTSVKNAAFTCPAATTWVTTTADFTYTGGSLYIAYDWTNCGTVSAGSVVDCNSTGLTAAVKSLQSAGVCTAITSTGANSIFRPRTSLTVLNDDITVLEIWNAGKSPVLLNTTQVIGGVIANMFNVSQTIDATFTVKEKISGATRYTTTQSLTIAGCATATITDNAWTHSLVETDSVVLAITATAGESSLANNRKASAQLVNTNTYDYGRLNGVLTGQVGFNTSAGLLLSKYKVTGTAAVKQIRVLIGGAGTGNIVYGVVVDNAGTIVGQSANYTLQVSDANNYVTFDILTPPSFSNTTFYAGMAQTANAVTGYFPWGSTDDLIRQPSLFYTAALAGSVPAELTGLNSRFFQEAIMDYAAVLAGSNTTCTGASTDLTVAIGAGSPPYTLVYSDGSTNSTVTGYTSGANIAVSPTTTTTYNLVSVTDANGWVSGILSGTPTVTPRPTAVLSGGGVGCVGTQNVSIALTGTAPWSLTYTDGTTPTTVSTSASPYVITGASAGNYSVTALSDANCTAQAGDMTGSATVTINALPSAIITPSGPTTICAGGSVTLSAPASTDAGNALSFNGTSTSVSTPNALSTATAFTIEYWMKTTQTGLSGVQWFNGNGIVDAEVSGIYDDFGTSLLNNKLAFGIGNPDITIQSTSDVNTGAWVHVAATWSGASNQMNLYINGNLENTTSPPNTNTRGVPSNISLGSLSPGIQFFDGQLDEVRIWTVIKTQAQIQASMNTTVANNSAGLVAYYTLNEGTGANTADATGNGNNGTLVNSPIWVVPSTAPIYSLFDTYAWTPGGASTSSIIATTSNTYTVTVTNGNACTATSSVTVIVNSRPTAALSGGGVVCSGATLPDVSIALTGTAPWSLTYTDGTTPTTVSTSASPYVITGASAGNYSVTALSDANCTAQAGDMTGSATVTVNTTSTAAVLSLPSASAPFIENFDTGIPATWTVLNKSTTIGSDSWFIGNPTVFPAFNGATNNYIAVNFNSTTSANTISNWLILPNMTLNNGDVFSFYTRTTNTPAYPDRLELRLSTNGASTNVGTTPTSVGDFSTLLLSVNPTLTTAGYPNTWTQYTATVVGLGGATSGRIAFRYFVTDGGPLGNNSDFIGIDAVNYTPVIPALATICDGGNTNIKVDITGGTGPYTVVYTDGTSNFTENTYTSGSNISVSPSATATYSLVSVTGANACPGTGNSGTAIVNVNPRPTAVLSGGGVVCSGATLPDVSIALTGTAPWSLTYTDGTTPTTVSTSASPYVITGASAGNYSVTALSDANCTAQAGDMTGSATVTVNTTSTGTTTATACDTYTWAAPLGDGATYTASGTFTNVSTNAAGCDHTETLNLTINNSTNNATTQSAVNSYVWNSTTYTLTGDYTYSYTNGSGCPSVDTLHLTILSPASALNLSGTNDEYITLASNPLQNATNFTFECWINPQSNAPWQRIIDFSNTLSANGGVPYIFFTADDGYTPRFVINDGNGEQVLDGTSLLPLNQWAHIAVTLDATTQSAKMYVNGVLAGQNNSFALTPSSVGATANTMIGRSSFSADAYLNASLDELRFWDRALSACEITASMSCELSTPQNGLVAYYQFNQGAAAADNTAISTVTDATANNNSGTLNNFILNGATSNFIAVGGVTTGVTCGLLPVATTGTTTANTCDSYTWAAPLGDGATYTASGTFINVSTNAAGCDHTETLVLTIIPNPTADVSGGGVACAGTQNVSIALTGTAPWSLTYTDGTTPTTVSTSASPYVITGASAGIYSVTALSDANCTAQAGDMTGSATVIDLPCSVIYTGTAACETYTLANVSGNAWFDVVGSNGIICSINPNGENLGDLTIEVGDPIGVDSANTTAFIGRNVNISSSTYPSGTIPTAYSLKIYYYDTEFDEYKTVISNTTATIADLNIAWASGGTGCALQDYASSSTSNGVVANSNVTNAQYGAADNGFYLQFDLDHFTIFAATVSNKLNPLPVKWLSVSANTKSDNTIAVDWATASEQNADYFAVERSQNGRDFQNIGNISAENSATGAAYVLNDTKPVLGINYYRIRQVDFDGKADYSKVVSAKIKATKDAINIYPNPTADVLNIVATSPAKLTAVLIDALGRTVSQTTFNTQTSIDTQNLSNGVYMLRILDGNEQKTTEKVLVQH